MRKYMLLMFMLAALKANAFSISCVQENIESGQARILNLHGSESNGYTLELIDPQAFQPLASLQLKGEEVDISSRTVLIDHWAGFAGILQLVTVFDAAATKSKHVFLDAGFGINDIGGGRGLLWFNTVSSKNGAKWNCEKD